MNIEVFKTNVEKDEEAERIIHIIRACFDGYKANFDLEDCDRILRVQSSNGAVKAEKITALLERLGYEIAMLPG